jgi:hypothetical protein
MRLRQDEIVLFNLNNINFKNQTKMKIKNLLLLGLMVFGSMNASAADFKAGGLVFNVDATAKTATVIGVRTGYITATQKSVEIPATVTDGDGVVCKVTGFASQWNSTAYTATGYETTATPGCESIIINIDNFGSVPSAAQLSFAKSITLKGTSTLATDYTVPNYTGTVTNLETLDLDELAAKSGQKVVLTAQTAGAKLKTVTLPNIDIPANAFMNQTALESVSGAKNIGANAFNGASKLATFDLSAVEEIGASAFVGTKITTANLAAATSIGQNAFKDVTTITSVTLNTVGDKTNHKVQIGNGAFDGLTELTELTIPATVQFPGGGTNVFANMAKLATVTILNDQVTATEFANDNAIATLTIKNADLATIPANAFTSTKIVALDLSMCPSLVVASGAFPANAFTKIKLSGSQTPIANFNLTSAAGSLKTLTLSADAGETTIPANKFQSFTKLANVSLPATITSIGNYAFEASALTAITIPEGCSIGDYAFANCADLATVTFVSEDPLTALSATIGDNAFEATAVAKVIIPANVTSLGADAFKDCALLKRFQANSAYDETADIKYGLTTIPAIFDGCDKLSEVVIPKTVISIANDAFKDHAKLATVTFKHEGKDDDASNALWSIGTSAFEGTAITTIDLSMTQLTSLNKDDVFKDCASLATITLPEEMNFLTGNAIFAGTAIETLDASMVNGTIGGWHFDSTLGASVPNTLFGTDEDNPNNTLKVLKVGNATIVGSSGWEIGAFAYCAKLKTLVAGAANIAPYAFGYCQKLATVTVLPYDVDASTGASISNNAFDHCSGLTTFNYMPETVDPTEFGFVHGRAFTGCTPFAEFNTCKEFATWYENVDTKAPKGKGWGGAPINTKWTADLVTTIVKTVQDKANPNQFIGKFVSTYDASFDANDAKLYSIYMDGETAYYAACRVDDGRYYVYAGDHVVLKTDEAKEVSWNVESTASMGNSAVGFDDVANLFIDGELADIQLVLGLMPGQYVYRFTNTEDQGFGFTYYSGSTIKANQFFVASTLKPEGAGRLNQVWLDEDGNVENDATAIQKIQNTDAEKGAVYNLQGVRVQKAQKGLYIQNGKKYVVK